MNRHLAWAAVVVTAGVALAGAVGLGTRPVHAQVRRLPAGAAIVGQVTDAQTGRGLDRVIIDLEGAGLRRRLVADARGRFLFTGLPTGDYLVKARRSGYLEGVFGQRRATGDGQLVSLVYGQWLGGLDMTLWKPGVITGDVRDDHGDPVVGVTVHAFTHDRLPQRTVLREVSRAVTDDTGRFRLDSLLPGDHVVGLAAGPDAEHTDYVFAPHYFPAADRVAGAVSVTVQAGREFAGIGFTLAAQPLFDVAGRVDTSQVPEDRIGTLRLSLARPPDPAVIEPSQHRVLRVVVPDADGHFRFADVPSGSWVIEASFAAPPPLDDSLEDEAEPGPDAPAPPAMWAMTPVEVTDKSVDDVVVSLQPGLTVEGRVSPSTVLTIHFEPMFDAAGVREVSLVSDAEGRFTSGPALVPGRYLVRVSGVPQELSLRSVTSGGRDVSDVALDVTPGFSVSDLLVELTAQTTQLAGTVRRLGPFADPHSIVLLLPQTDTDGGARRVRSVRARPDGAFYFRALPPGAYLVVAIDDAEAYGWQAPDRLRTLRRRATPVTLREGEAKVLELQRVASR